MPTVITVWFAPIPDFGHEYNESIKNGSSDDKNETNEHSKPEVNENIPRSSIDKLNYKEWKLKLLQQFVSL
jgi:hypothetical protein